MPARTDFADAVSVNRSLVTLPGEFAVDAEKEKHEANVYFSEEEPLVLSGADKDFFLEMLDNPPKANDALKQLMKG